MVVISNEPGVYFENQYGIRIENLITLLDKDDYRILLEKNFYPFVPSFVLTKNYNFFFSSAFYLLLIRNTV
jgi:Xaa-Pro aminopeptidase